MTANPDFVDNREGNTLQKAIVDQLASIRTAKSPADELWIATAYFNPGGLELLAKDQHSVSTVVVLPLKIKGGEASLVRPIAIA